MSLEVPPATANTRPSTFLSPTPESSYYAVSPQCRNQGVCFSVLSGRHHSQHIAFLFPKARSRADDPLFEHHEKLCYTKNLLGFATEGALQNSYPPPSQSTAVPFLIPKSKSLALSNTEAFGRWYSRRRIHNSALADDLRTWVIVRIPPRKYRKQGKGK